jgi:site-specific DNA-methyltransferase (adenine-specific)
MPISETHNEDCLLGMARFPDKFWDLAICDPEYGINITASQRLVKEKGWTDKGWDKKPPSVEYFKELSRVSKNQIIWGGNYFIDNLTSTRCFIIWDKKNDGRDFADCEFAWTSIDEVARIFRMRPQNMDGGKVHPTQKPIALYSWLLQNYARPGDKILDTHLGSGSSRIAAYKLGFDFYGWEIDKEYYEAQEERFKKAIAEPLFEQVKPLTQSKLL